ncbi:hypothetical protein HMPREF2625_00675 [Rothia sp. HMSC064D08]|nr:hypothetical protein HMPREF2625_00675 [Rothia sp. HMSC064D08]
MKIRFLVCAVRPSLGRHGSGNIGQHYMPDAGRGLHCTRFLLRSKPFISLLFLPILSPASSSNLPHRKALYVNKEGFSTLYSHKDPFYTLTLSKGYIFCVKYAVKLLVPSSRNESPAQFANLHSVMTFGADELEHRRFRVREAPNLRAEGAQARVDMSLYGLVETAQAIIISYILTDGSAQAVSDVVEAISVFLRRLR